jgi:mannitol-1-phosphate 5-dehydrogenase
LEKAIIFGAGKTGRGFAAHLAYLGGYEIVFVDKNRQLVEELNKAGQYYIDVLDKKEKSTVIPVSAAYRIEDASWHEDFIATGLVFTAVFGNNFEYLANHLATALAKRYNRNPTTFLTIITCENLAHAASILKEMVLQNLGQEKENWLSKYVGFSEAIIFKTCLEAAPNQLPLTVRAQDFFELPSDAGGIRGSLHVPGLKPLNNFDNQLKRKIFTYNCINAVITYLGALKGYEQLYEAGNDREILEVAGRAARETSAALVAEFNFDSKEQEEWTAAAFAKFADRNIPDPIERNAADPVRKLNRDDRLIGPALLALKHGIQPEGLLDGIIACFEYFDPNKKCRVADVIREKGADTVLEDICGLSENEELFTLIKKEINKRSMNGN